jgi:3-oxoadipate enol-lactonase
MRWRRASKLDGRKNSVKVDGLHYDVTGEGPAVVLLHAGGLDSRMWGPQLRSLSASHTVVRCDMRGSGQSDRPLAPFSPSEDVVTVMRHAGVTKAAVVGASLGGRTALDLALDHPELVTVLVVAAAAITGFELSLDYQQMMVSILGPLALGNVDAYVEAFLDSSLGPRDEESQPLVARMLIDNQNLFTGDAALLLPSEPPAMERLSATRVPTLILTGAGDHPDIGEMAVRLQSMISVAEAETIAGAKHLVSLDRPEEFNRAVLRFLAAHPVAG